MQKSSCDIPIYYIVGSQGCLEWLSIIPMQLGSLIPYIKQPTHVLIITHLVLLPIKIKQMAKIDCRYSIHQVSGKRIEYPPSHNSPALPFP